MSIKIMSQIWQDGPQSMTDRFVLLAIADYANDDGEAWPSIAGLMKKTTLSDRGVQKTIRRLEADGWLEIKTGNGRKGCNNYTIKTPNHVHPRTTFTPNMSAETPNVETQNPEPRSPEPSRTIIEPSYSSPSPREAVGTQDDFDQFWRAYPHKVQQPSARGAYQFSCLKASPAEILAGAIRYARKADDRPWMNPAKWLAEECWNDRPGEPPGPRRSISKTEEAGQRFFQRGFDNETDNETSDLRNVLQLPTTQGRGT